jgi:hypothetical protein
MPYIDRDEFIRTLERLGDPDDAVALAAARDVARRVAQSDAGWDALLVPPPGAADEDAIATVPAPRPIAPGDAESEGQLIDRLLASFELGAETREMLIEFKGDIARGEFTEDDHAYVRSLAARLDKRGGA